ncbi:MAG: hypothetical protein SFZ24_11485 [Planctomycetota bacterium]|nr:hypothetical protein [Planctomycetota bacterium]
MIALYVRVMNNRESDVGASSRSQMRAQRDAMTTAVFRGIIRAWLVICLIVVSLVAISSVVRSVQ